MSHTARIFNGAVAAAAISASFELGMLEEIEQHGGLDVGEFCRREGLSRRPVEAILQVLDWADAVSWTSGDERAIAGGAFDDIYAEKGYFLWLVRGYSDMLANAAALSRRGALAEGPAPRDAEYIAIAGRDYGSRYVDRHFLSLLAEDSFRCGADLGCGSGERLLRLARRWPDFRGIGIERSPQAVAVARAAVTEAGMGDRLEILEGDVGHLEYRPELERVELAFSFFMGHDLWPREACIDALQSIREAFPQLRRFLLCDTYRSQGEPGEVPIFTLGFELTHALMGQSIPSLDDWRGLFDEAGWECVREEPVGIPFSTIFDLRPKAA